MKQLQPDLWQSSRYSSGELNTYAYLVKRPKAGNILFYNTGNEADLAAIDKLGGIEYQLLSHRDEASPSLARIKERFGNKLGCSALEVPSIGAHTEVDLTLKPGDQQLGDVQVIETPGHTDGSVCFFYTSPHGKSYLFTGDTIFPWDGKLSTLAFPQNGGSVTSLAASLNRLREFAPDIVMSSAFVGDVAEMKFTGTEWIQAIDDAISDLQVAR
ncbi:MBL fold metallo-hydrolase [Mycobacterium sp.]|uniref:MBL fold metallo-hydrolase n=1 Tax=Mycobacterium sp. TaxID=1785 RepID=UPI003BAA00D2